MNHIRQINAAMAPADGLKMRKMNAITAWVMHNVLALFTDCSAK